MRPAKLASLLLILACSLSGAPLAHADYSSLKGKLAETRHEWGSRVAAVDDHSEPQVERAVLAGVFALAHEWMGTRWGLGVPQAETPGPDRKINCGTFVGTVLRDAGFVVDVRKLQRQPSQLIIRSFVGHDRTRRFSNTPMPRFLASLRAMGPGLFIIGLDFHVGLLVQTASDLRFVHASYVTGKVVDEPAATAEPIVDSEYRVVGKILSRDNLDAWLTGRRIDVAGSW